MSFATMDRNGLIKRLSPLFHFSSRRQNRPDCPYCRPCHVLHRVLCLLGRRTSLRLPVDPIWRRYSTRLLLGSLQARNSCRKYCLSFARITSSLLLSSRSATSTDYEQIPSTSGDYKAKCVPSGRGAIAMSVFAWFVSPQKAASC